MAHDEAHLEEELHALLAEPDHRLRRVVARVEGLSPGQVAAWGLFVAAWEVYRGILVLLERRLAQEGLMLTRTLIDDALRLMWFEVEPDELEARALRFDWTSAKKSHALYKAAKEIELPWADQALIESGQNMHEIRRQFRRLGKDEPEGLPDAWRLMEDLEQKRLAYWHLRGTQSIHSTGIGIGGRLQPPATDDDATMVLMESPPIEVARVGVLAAETMMGAAVAACALLPWGGRDEMEAYANQLSPRLKDLFRRFKAAAGEPVTDDG